MHEILHMWSNTRMVVLTALCASIYAAVLIPFMVVPLIPGVTHFRPANALPVVCSFLFGPAAAWGAAIGNLIGDFFSGVGPGDFFGFVANFLYGLVPYRMWRAWRPDGRLPAAPGEWAFFFTTITTACLVCSAVVGFGLEFLGFVPFAVLANVLFLNNLVTTAVLAPLLLRVLHPRVRRARLLYTDVLGPVPPQAARTRALGIALVVIGSVVAFVAGNLVSGGWLPPEALFELSSSYRLAVAVVPPLAVAVLGALLL